MNIEWSPQALADLKVIYSYITRENPPAARKLHERITSCISLLAETPHIGRVGRIAGTKELVVSGTSYIVPYRVIENTLQLLRVYHSSRKWPETFNS